MKAKNLQAIPLNKVHLAQQAALMRLQIFMVGATHRLFYRFASQAKASILGYAGAEKQLDGLALAGLRSELDTRWRRTFAAWKRLFRILLRDAASIPFGVLAVYHNNLLLPVVRSLGEARRVRDGVFEPQLDLLLDAANRHVYDDGLTLSQRIWRLEHESLDGIQALIMAGVANKRSAWDIAVDLERYLGAGAGCPRWTRDRLSRLTKKDIASGDRRGLYSDGDCNGQGVAYNALRLARNEIQTVHHLATDALAAKMPWVEKERVHLSPDHPKPDICDAVTSGGEDGQGIYPKGSTHLPLHVQCLCFKSFVLTDREQFITRLSDWMKEGQAWPEMDAYVALVGGNLQAEIPGGVIVGVFTTWLWDEYEALLAHINSE